MKHFLLLPIIITMLTSCALTSPRDVGNGHMFTLSPPPVEQVAHTRKTPLIVRYPTLPSELDTYRIAVTTADGRRDYFAGAKWSEFLPALVQSSLREFISASSLFSYVDNDERTHSGAYHLLTDIDDFRAVYTDDKLPPEIVIGLNMRLTQPSTHKTLMKARIETRVTASGNTMHAIAAAFNEAYTQSVNELAERLQAGK